MRNSNQTFIAEIKTKSPFGYQSPHSFNVTMETAIEFGDWISVHDNALWGGDFETISLVRKNTDKPILAKGLHSTDDDIKRALDHGATYVLVVDRLPDESALHDKCLFEWSNVVDWKNWINGPYYYGAPKHVHNARDLKTGIGHKYNSLPDYIEFKKKSDHPYNKPWICQASHIKTAEDVNSDVDAFIVGTYLYDFCVAIHSEQRRLRRKY